MDLRMVIGKEILCAAIMQRNDCAQRARVVSKLVLRVRAIRSLLARCSTARRRADSSCPSGKRKLSS